MYTVQKKDDQTKNTGDTKQEGLYQVCLLYLYQIGVVIDMTLKVCIHCGCRSMEGRLHFEHCRKANWSLY